MIGPYPTILDDWGAKNTYKLVVDGQWSRLFMPIFLHSGVIHLLGNLAIQLDQCKLYEQQWGIVLYSFIYIATGISGCVFSAVSMPGSLGVGGSGAIMGVLGARIGEGLVKYYDAGGGIDDLCVTGVSVIFVLLMSFVPFVDWPAHVGGMASGFVLGLIAFSHQNFWGRYGCKVRTHEKGGGAGGEVKATLAKFFHS
jgi:membrane associated rhomboid family serine protease